MLILFYQRKISAGQTKNWFMSQSQNFKKFKIWLAEYPVPGFRNGL